MRILQEEKVDKLKEDWFSSNGVVTVNIYCKGALPDETTVHTDGQLLRIALSHGFGCKETSIIYDLFGRIIPDDSKVVVGERKVCYLFLYFESNLFDKELILQ